MTDSVQASTTVYLASFAALLGALSMGLALGYTAPAFIDMDKDTNSTILSWDKDKRLHQQSWIGSILAIGALVGGLLGEPSNKYFGRRMSLILYGIPFVIGWLLIAFAQNFVTIMFGRLLTGLCCGLVSGTAPTYVVEISPPQIRGLLGTCFQVMVTIGILLAALLGMALSWSTLAGVSVIAAIGMSAFMIPMPETPQWLLGRGDSEEAEASLKRLRTTAINSEFNLMTQVAQTNRESSTSQYSFESIKSREFYKPFILALGLMFFQQFSGINAVLFYQGAIFKKASPSLDPSLATIYVCIAQTLATIVGSILVDRTGRKALLLASGAGHAISLFTLGVYFKLSVSSDASFQETYAWIALVSLIIFISSFSIGYGPIPWMMIPEFSSSRMRSMIASLATAFNWTCVWIVTGNVMSLMKAIGDDWTYWIFAIICAISCVFVSISLPETKGRSSEQIQHELLGGSSGSGNATAQDQDQGVIFNARPGAQVGTDSSLKAMA